MRLGWLIAAFFLSGLLALLNEWALEDFLFWRYTWFDLPMHYLGGLAIGAFVVGVTRTYRPRLFLAGLVLAYIGWEVFEYIFGLPKEANYAIDTLIDLVMDGLGGLTAYVLARRTIWKQ